ncbi:MAG: DNA type IV secretion system protein ComB10 [Endomicrobium sp.]|jgi:type IV secretory pathway VirB10-like protein|nr:DNA type IV secretion system protein ComB10 [Endomicrobium sp.]
MRKEKQVKPALKVLIITLVFVFLIMGSLILYVIFSDDTIQTEENDSFIDTRFPLSSYLYQEQQSNIPTNLETTPQSYTTPQINEEALPVDIITRVKENAVVNIERVNEELYDESIFPEIDSKEQLRKALLASRLNIGISTNIPSSNYISAKNRIDYGADQFENYNTRDDGTNEHKLLRTITADRMIPAILINAITSDLSGKVVAQVEEDMFAAMGRAVLIPKGSRVIGEYINNNKLGENRLQIVWTRIITPHGINILLTNTQSADVIGQSGVLGELDNKYWERYGLALTLSTLSNALMILIANETQNFDNSQTQTILDKSGNDISTIINHIIKEQIKVNPTIRIEAGSRIFINPTVDIWIPVPKNRETLAQYFEIK